MKPKYKRLLIILATLACFGGAIALVLIALQDNVTYFYKPSDLKNRSLKKERIRIGGYVKNGSIIRAADGITFVVTDMTEDLIIKYDGIVPDLFREGQGVIAEGVLLNQLFIADKLLAKHDENYTPPQIAKAMKDK